MEKNNGVGGSCGERSMKKGKQGVGLEASKKKAIDGTRWDEPPLAVEGDVAKGWLEKWQPEVRLEGDIIDLRRELWSGMEVFIALKSFLALPSHQSRS